MIVLESIRQALRTLWAHKLRASLTLFGFVWGTASIIFLVGWGQGVGAMLEAGFSKTGKNMGTLYAGKISEDFTPASDRRFLWFNTEDVEAARRLARQAELVAGQSQRFVLIAHGQTSMSTDLRGLEPETMAIRGAPVASGRGITRTDLDHRRRVVVIGHRLRRVLLGAQGGLGSWVRIDGTPFEVVGILAERGVQLNRDGLEIDDQAWIPLTTYQQKWPSPWTQEAVVDNVVYRVTDRHQYESARDELRAILARRLRVPPGDREAVGGWSPIEILNKLPADDLEGLMFLIAFTTMLIGGIGILNMMLDGVHERRQEIGIRLAVGARKREVLLQFFLESFVITAVGGLLGVSLGVAACLALAQVDAPEVIPMPVLDPELIVSAIVVMSGIGLVAAIWPAWRAVRVDPAVTLRME